MMDLLSAALVSINNASKARKSRTVIKGYNNVIKEFLLYMVKKGYLESIEFVEDGRQGKVIINLNGRLNKCAVITPRYNLNLDEIETLREKTLLSRQFGHLLVTTDKGIMDHADCVKSKVGGQVLGYFY